MHGCYLRVCVRARACVRACVRACDMRTHKGLHPLQESQIGGTIIQVLHRWRLFVGATPPGVS